MVGRPLSQGGDDGSQAVAEGSELVLDAGRDFRVSGPAQQPVAIWENGTLVRSLATTPADRIVENIGTPLPFEAPYWAGDHPVGGGYPLPFHPLELGGGVALRALFGFVIEGRRGPADIDAGSVKLAGFRVPPAHPITPEMIAEFTRTHKRTRYQMGPDGKLIQVGDHGRP